MDISWVPPPGFCRSLGFRVWGLGSSVAGLGFSVEGLGLGYKVSDLRFRI